MIQTIIEKILSAKSGVSNVQYDDRVWINLDLITMRDFGGPNAVIRYQEDVKYREWYDTFTKNGVLVFYDNGVKIPIEEIVDIPVPILDVNAIVYSSQTERSHYDQELDNEFISGENRAIGVFQEADLKADDLREQIAKYNTDKFENVEFKPENYE